MGPSSAPASIRFFSCVSRYDALWCHLIMAAKSAWQRYFKATETTPLNVVNEDFIENYEPVPLTIFLTILSRKAPRFVENN
jgi:hypothetical protein